MSRSRCQSEPLSVSYSSPVFSQRSISETSDSTDFTYAYLTFQGNLRSDRAKSVNDANPRPSRPMFDPKALLNPRAAKRSRDRDNEEDRQDGGSHSETTDISPRISSMIERMHKLERREDQPRKKQKTDGEAVNGAKEKAAFNGGGNGTVLGEYVKEKRKEGMSEMGTASVVDLTGGDDDDDLILVSDTGDREVCLGKLEGPCVNAYQVPAPRPGGFQPASAQWPMMNVVIRRRPGSNVVMPVADPTGTEFGSLDAKTASALAPLMDAAHTNKIRMKVRLEMRRRRTGDTPGQPISQVLPLNLHLYAPRKMADGIGKFLSQRNLWLRQPTIVDRGIEVYNPHTPKAVPVKPITALGSTSGVPANYVARNVEEIRSDVLNMFDTLTKSEDLPTKEQDALVVTPLLTHQKQALYFMTERERERGFRDDDSDQYSLWRLKLRPNGRRVFFNVITGNESPVNPPPVLGGILADMMGLGKTLSILSLIAATMDEALAFSKKAAPQDSSRLLKLNCKTTLLICPLSTVANWEEQINLHTKSNSLTYYIYHGQNRTKDVKELAKYDLVITTYSIVATEFYKPSRGPLEELHWFRVVLDEAHMIRQTNTRQSQAACALSAQRRWAVTGTPVQNRLDDLGALIKFLKIKPFDEKGGFTQYILAPFKNADPEILPKLRLLVDSITLRRLKDHIDLPARHDQITRLDFTDAELALYDFFAKDSAKKVRAVSGNTKGLGGKVYVHILRAILRLRQLCASGQDMLNDEDMKMLEGFSYSNAIDLGDEDEDDKPALIPRQAYDMLHLLRENDMDRCSLCNRKVGELDDASEDALDGTKGDNTIGHMTPCYQIICPSCFKDFSETVQQRATSDNYMTCPLCDQYVRVSFYELRQDEWEEDQKARNRIRSDPKLAKQLGRYSGPHTKTRALLESLHEHQAWSNAHPDEAPIKSVIFSGWTSHLDLIQIALEDHNFSFTRLDGSMARKARAAALNTFRDDPNVPIMLVSIGAGGLGLNLTTASKVYMMEPQFNPAAEAQAAERVHRLGQKREVTITRFIMQDSFEEKMLELQRKKRDLADLSMNRNVKMGKEESIKKKLEELKALFR